MSIKNFSFCCVIAGSLLTQSASFTMESKETTTTEVDSTNQQAPDSEIHSAPNYHKIEPMPCWNRYTGDNARSISGWMRWWKYITMKNPVTMKWIDGLKLKIYPSNEMYRSLYIRGIYDPNIVALTIHFLPEDGVLLDVGANSGYVSLLAAKKVMNKNGRVIAIEPSSREYKRLVENISLNHSERTIQSVMLAVGDRAGVKTIQVASEERSSLNTLAPGFTNKGVSSIATEEVTVTTLDKIVDLENVDRVDVIKLDIEGSEARALEGAKDTIENFKPIIIMGINKKALQMSKRSVQDIEKLLNNYNYIAYKITKKSFVLEKMNDLSEISSDIIVCLHKDTPVPALPQPTKIGIWQKIIGFFE